MNRLPRILLRLDLLPAVNSVLDQAVAEQGLEVSICRVSTKSGYRRAVTAEQPDLIVFGGALSSAQILAEVEMARRILPRVEVLCVCADLEEEAAAESSTAGSLDWVAQQPYSRLLRELRRAVENSELRIQGDLWQARYDDIFENPLIGIEQVTPDGRILKANAALAKIFGFSSAQELVTTVTDIGTQLYCNAQDAMEMMWGLEKDGAVQNMEVKIKRRDGAERWISKSVRAVRHKAGGLLYFEGYVQDITAHKELEVKYLRAQRLESLGAMTESVVHELNNHFAPILMFAPLLSTRLSLERLEEIARIIELSAKRGSDMVKKLALYGRKMQGAQCEQTAPSEATRTVLPG